MKPPTQEGRLKIDVYNPCAPCCVDAEHGQPLAVHSVPYGS